MKQELIVHNLYFGCLATDFLDFFYKHSLCVAMATMLVKDIPPNVSQRAADCN